MFVISRMIEHTFVLFIHTYPALVWHKVSLNKYVLNDNYSTLYHARWHKNIKKNRWQSYSLMAGEINYWWRPTHSRVDKWLSIILCTWRPHGGPERKRRKRRTWNLAFKLSWGQKIHPELEESQVTQASSMKHVDFWQGRNLFWCNTMWEQLNTIWLNLGEILLYLK